MTDPHCTGKPRQCEPWWKREIIPFFFFNVLILDFPQRIFSLGVPYVDSLS